MVAVTQPDSVSDTTQAEATPPAYSSDEDDGPRRPPAALMSRQTSEYVAATKVSANSLAAEMAAGFAHPANGDGDSFAGLESSPSELIFVNGACPSRTAGERRLWGR